MKKLLCVVGAFLLTVSEGFSQSQMSSGNINGGVVDSSGAVLARATVSISNLDTGLDRSVTTGEYGDLPFLALPPGNYSLTVEAAGFAVYVRRPIQLTVGQALNIEAQLEPAGIRQEILVQEEAVSLEPERTQQSDTITNERIQNLPINERNFLNFAEL